MLARQFLLERTSLPLVAVVERMGGLQTQYAPSGYVGLWTRVAGVERDDLTRALERRSVIQGTLMRVTIHMVSRRDYPLFAAGLREDRRAWWLKVTKRGSREIEDVARRVRAFLADGPRPRREIQKELGLDSSTFNGVGLWVDLVRVPPLGTWERKRADLYGLAEQWVGPLDADPARGIEHLTRRYLGGFGPASRKDIAGWAGLRAATLGPVLERMKLRRLRDQRGTELLDLPRTPIPDPRTPAPVRFLPTWDATLLVNCRRAQILPERYRPIVFSTTTPHSFGTILVDGQVAGTWKPVGSSIEVKPLEKLSRSVAREVADEAERLREFVR